MSYRLEWIAAPVFLGAPLLLLIGPFAVIAVLVAALAALAALVALAGLCSRCRTCSSAPSVDTSRISATQRNARRRSRQRIYSKDLTMNPSQREAVDQLIARVLRRA